MNKFIYGTGILMSGLIMAASTAQASQVISLNINESRYFDAKRTIARIAIANPEIADVHTLPSNKEILIVSKSAGTTTLLIWTIDNKMKEYTVVVSPEDPGQALVIESAIGLPEVRVTKVNDKILLTGYVKNQYEHNYALQVARLYAGSGDSSNGGGGVGNINGHSSFGSGVDLEIGANNMSGSVASNGSNSSKSSEDSIIDLLEIRHLTKVKFEAQIVEIASDDAKDIGIQYGANISDTNTPSIDSNGIYYFGENYSRRTDYDSFRSKPLKWAEQHFAPINARIQALVTNGKAKILSRPYISTLSGQEANIHIGGTVKIRSTADNVEPEDMDYGITLKVKPIVDNKGNIISSVYSEVSDYQYLNGDPGKTERRASAVISLKSNETFVIGGLYDSSDSKTIRKIPLLGDIPIIGEFFKHTARSKEKRELIILITPSIVEEDNTTAKMSDRMKETYEEGKKEQELLNDVEIYDLNNVNKSDVNNTNAINETSETSDVVENDLSSEKQKE